MLKQNKQRKYIITSIVLFVGSLSFGFVPKSKISDGLGNLKLKNWGLSNSSRLKSDISILDAWKISKGSKDILVAVVDTGIDSNHVSLKSNVWHNKKEQYGWNFVKDAPNPNDEHGHGTHVAGIIGAITDLSSGVAGVAQNVSILAAKYYSDANTGSQNLKNSVRALHYAIDNGARVINYSGGGPEFSEEEFLALKRAESAGILIVAAAGNERQNSDLVENYYYPAAYQLSNIISVAATDINNNLLRSSNWGKSKVDVAAPGEQIYSTLPGNRYGTMTGTSQATAFVSGLAALLLSQNPKLTPRDLKEIIRASVDQIPQLQQKVGAGGRINAYTALNNLQMRRSPVRIAQRAETFANVLAMPFNQN